MKKLHLGCGRNYLPGFTNVDLFSSIRADLYADVQCLPFDRGRFDLIYACHVLEHVHRNAVIATLTHWRDLLVPGGVLRLAVPNFEAIVEHYQKTQKLQDLIGLLYGGQNHPMNNHFIAFDTKTLCKALLDAGFKATDGWDWRETEHAQFDDYASAYLPHMQKDTGLLMSLNIQAVK